MSETEFDGDSDKLIVVSRYLVTDINLLNKTTTTKKFRQGIGAKLAFKCKKVIVQIQIIVSTQLLNLQHKFLKLILRRIYR